MSPVELREVGGHSERGLARPEVVVAQQVEPWHGSIERQRFAAEAGHLVAEVEALIAAVLLPAHLELALDHFALAGVDQDLGRTRALVAVADPDRLRLALRTGTEVEHDVPLALANVAHLVPALQGDRR